MKQILKPFNVGSMMMCMRGMMRSAPLCVLRMPC